MIERNDVVSLKGNPITLLGYEVKIGDKTPDFFVVDNELNPIQFAKDYKGKKCLIISVPSLDTSVCDLETRRFNKEAENMDNDLAILVISMDLPFAQKRWCGAAGIERLKTLSDYQQASFGAAFGILIKEIKLLARAIFLIDQSGTIKYIQIIKEVTSEPYYEEVLDAIKSL